MIPDNYSATINKLADKTRLGLVDWVTTSSSTKFLVRFAKFSVSIYQGYDSDEDNQFVRFDIFDFDGKEMDTFHVTQLETDWQLANDLFGAARRKALKIDEAISTINGELDALEVSEEPF